MVQFNPYDPALIDDPYPAYTALRDEAPAYYGESQNFWALSRFADVKAALADNETYCSSQGLLVLEATDDYAAPEFPPGNLLLMDPPEHTAYRQMVNKRFLQRGVAALETRMRDTANALVDRFVERGSVDLVAEYTAALPATVFGELLGIPASESATFQELSAQLVSPAPTPEAMAAHHEATESVSECFRQLLVEKRAHPADDLLTELAHGSIDGEPIAEPEFVGFAIAMLIAGNDTTSNFLANAGWLLAAHPDQRALLRKDPTLLANAVEEILRIEAPVHGLARTLTRDVELHGHTMSEGQKVLLLFGSGNRDEREFDAPDRFDVTRQFESHLSFGFGIHYCIGIHLGRLEGRVGIETLLTRLGDYELASDTVHWRQAIPTRPMAGLPITFTPARRSGTEPVAPIG
jgi:cytochrome P450